MTIPSMYFDNLLKKKMLLHYKLYIFFTNIKTGLQSLHINYLHTKCQQMTFSMLKLV